MKISEIVRRVRGITGDMTSYQYTNEMMTDWINDAIREAVEENGLLQKRASQNLVVGTYEYNLPTDIFKLHSITVSGNKIPILTLQEWEQYAAFGQPTPTGQPTACYVFTGKLTVYPTPDSVLPLQINYLYTPTAIEYTGNGDATWQNSVPSIPESYHLRLVAYCIAQVALIDEDMAKYNLFMDQFKSGVVNLKAKQDTEDDLYPHISPSGRDSGDGWESVY